MEGVEHVAANIVKEGTHFVGQESPCYNMNEDVTLTFGHVSVQLCNCSQACVSRVPRYSYLGNHSFIGIVQLTTRFL